MLDVTDGFTYRCLNDLVLGNGYKYLGQYLDSQYLWYINHNGYTFSADNVYELKQHKNMEKNEYIIDVLNNA